MKYINNMLAFICLFMLFACQNNKFEHDPTKPYPELKVGERWNNKYDSRGLQNGIIKGNFLFVNTINISKGKNYLYCLNLKTKKVEWKNEVDFFASQPVCISTNQLFYMSYVGNIYSFSLDGKKLWSIKPRLDYTGYKLNSINRNFVVTTVTHDVYEFDKNSGKEIKHYVRKE